VRGCLGSLSLVDLREHVLHRNILAIDEEQTVDFIYAATSQDAVKSLKLR
jgi:hypothetical protein